jgi:hypothetical protein
MSTLRNLAILGAALVGATVPVTSAADAAVIERGSFVDPIDETVQDFCDIAGLTVHNEGTFSGRFMGRLQGAEQLPHFQQHGVLRLTHTNVENGRTASVVERTLSKDLKVTDNGDGTLTILVLATGTSTLYGGDGTPIARNPGQVRYEILVDDAGTPSDPSDDVFLEFLGQVKGSTGRSDDYCAALAAELT